MTEKLLPSTDLSALFGIDIDQGAAGEQAPPIDGIVCAKCRGKGSFIGWSGKTLGKCFACDGTGIERHVAVDIKPGDCAKCLGSGAWRTRMGSNGHGCVWPILHSASRQHTEKTPDHFM